MQRIAQAPSVFIATLWVDVLKAEGIQASVQRQYLSGVAGELPPDQCLPEVWIEQSHHAERAEQVLNHLQHMPQQRWLCTCGELVEGGFQQCWNCAEPMPTELSAGTG